MHRRNEIDWALPSMTPKAVADTPLGLRARQCQADADVEAWGCGMLDIPWDTI
jgi:hypothetical protein